MVHVQGLRCRECGREYDAAPIFTCEWCFGPLEVAYDYDAIARSVTREKIAAGPLSLWRYSDLLPVEGDSRGRPRHGVHAARARRPARRRARARRGVGEERHPQPDELVQGPRRLGRAEQGARVRLQGRRVRVDRQPRRTPSPHTRRVPACAATCSSPPTSNRARSSRPRYTAATSLRSTATTTTSTACVRSSRASTSGRSSTSTCVRTTPRVRRRSRSRPPSSSAGPCPTTWSCRSRAVRCSPRSARASTSSTRSVCSTRSRNVRVSGAQARGCSPVAEAFIEKADTIRPVKPDTIAKSLAIGNPADGYFALDVVRSTGGGFGSVTDEEIVDGMRLLARTEGIFAETAGGVTVATLKKLAADGVIRPDERVVVYITGHGLKTLEAVSRRMRPDRDDRSHTRRLPRGVRHRGVASRHERHRPHPHAAAQPLRATRPRSQVEAGTVAEALKALESRVPRLRRAAVRRDRRAASLRQRVPRRRGHPLPAGSRLAGRRRADAQHRSGRRRRLSRRHLPVVGRCPTIETERLWLRPFREDDVDRVHRGAPGAGGPRVAARTRRHRRGAGVGRDGAVARAVGAARDRTVGARGEGVRARSSGARGCTGRGVTAGRASRSAGRCIPTIGARATRPKRARHASSTRSRITTSTRSTA